MRPPFDPLDPAEYPGLLRRSRRDAELEGMDPSVGEDALQDVLARVAAGKELPAGHRAYFRTCVLNRIRDIARHARRAAPIDDVLFSSTDPERKSRRLLLLGALAKRPEVERERGEEELRDWLGKELAALERDQSLAVRAQIRGWLEQEGGRESVRAFERHWGVELGPHVGTAGLAIAVGKPPATVASWAHRGMKRLASRAGRGG